MQTKQYFCGKQATLSPCAKASLGQGGKSEHRSAL